MCLVYNGGQTTRLRNRLEASGGKLVLWKVYERVGRALRSVYRGSVHRSCKPVLPGWVKSDRKAQVPFADAQDGGTAINRGIHLFTTARRARAGAARIDVIVPVTCHARDLVAGGEDSEAVFMKVHLKKADYEKAIKGAA